MKLPIQSFEQSGGKPPHSIDEETLEDDVNYGIADCRKRLRSQRSTLRPQHPPKDGSNRDVSPPNDRIGSYAEVFANVSMSQGSLSKLVECLLEPVNTSDPEEESIEREEAVIT
jgi:hypothetical protein